MARYLQHSVVAAVLGFCCIGCGAISGALEVAEPGLDKLDDLPIPIPTDLVAEGLGQVAFQAALLHAQDAGDEADMKLVKEVLADLLEHSEGETTGVDDWNIHIVESESADAVAFPGGGLLIGYPLLACPADYLHSKEHSSRRARSAKAGAACKEPRVRAHRRAVRPVLSVVLSHEVSHVEAGHFAERLQADANPVLVAVTQQIVQEIKSGKISSDPKAILNTIAEMSFSKETIGSLLEVAGMSSVEGKVLGHPFLVAQETRSDCHGAKLMRAAGYDPEAATAFWQASDSGSRDGILYEAHPASEERLLALEKCIASLPVQKARGAQANAKGAQ